MVGSSDMKNNDKLSRQTDIPRETSSKNKVRTMDNNVFSPFHGRRDAHRSPTTGIWMGDSDFAPVRGPARPHLRGASAARPSCQARLANPVPGDPRPFEVAGFKPGKRYAAAER